MEEPLVEVTNLSFSYDGPPVLKDVNLSVRPGDFVAVLGPNGGGKTTLLKLIMGILKPGRGRVRVLGRPPGRSAERVGYVPQETELNKSFPASAIDVALMGRLGRGGWPWRYNRGDLNKARQALDEVGLGEFKDRPVSRLSGGQRQRVLIARALAGQPELLVMDEPTASVDRTWQTELFELLKRLNEAMTIIVVSHDLSVLSSYVKSVACVNQSLYFHDSAEITAEMLEQAYHCPVELIAHGLPHRVLKTHEDD